MSTMSQPEVEGGLMYSDLIESFFNPILSIFLFSLSETQKLNQLRFKLQRYESGHYTGHETAAGLSWLYFILFLYYILYYIYLLCSQ